MVKPSVDPGIAELNRSIDFDFIKQLEGDKTDMYVPIGKDGQVSGNSGPTIASGFDLGQRNLGDLKGLKPEIKKKLKPYLGMKGEDALNFVTANPLKLTEDETTAINKFVKTTEMSKVQRLWDSSKPSVLWKDLTKPQATVVASVAFQYGAGLATETPRFWKAATTGDWDGVETELRNFEDEYPTRRNLEANFLQEQPATPFNLEAHRAVVSDIEPEPEVEVTYASALNKGGYMYNADGTKRNPNTTAHRLFNKGGEHMDEEEYYDDMGAQMEMSGLVQDEEVVDPVSGNDIPLGATAEGVRDDKTVALSAGEFVIPDYAVRYHGVDFYMDSLQLAKEGLAQMEDMGMTGKPEEAIVSADEPLPTMAGGGYAKKAALNVPVDTRMFEHGGLHGDTYTVPGQQFAAAPVQAAPVTTAAPAPVALPQPARPTVRRPRARTVRDPRIAYYDYQGPAAGLPGGAYAIKEFKNPQTGESIWLPTFDDNPYPGTVVPPGFIPAKDAAEAAEETPAPPVTPTPVGPSEQDILEDEARDQAEYDAAKELEITKGVNDRKAAVAEALEAVKKDTGGEGPDPDLGMVPRKYGMIINGKFTRNVLDIQKFENARTSFVWTEDHPLSKLAKNILTNTPGARLVSGLGKGLEKLTAIIIDGFNQNEEDDGPTGAITPPELLSQAELEQAQGMVTPPVPANIPPEVVDAAKAVIELPFDDFDFDFTEASGTPPLPAPTRGPGPETRAPDDYATALDEGTLAREPEPEPEPKPLLGAPPIIPVTTSTLLPERVPDPALLGGVMPVASFVEPPVSEAELAARLAAETQRLADLKKASEETALEAQREAEANREIRQQEREAEAEAEREAAAERKAELERLDTAYMKKGGLVKKPKKKKPRKKGKGLAKRK